MAARTTDNAIGVRRLGFGVSGPLALPITPPNFTAGMIQRAYELGVRLFDTAPVYGAGEGERRLGEALARLPRHDCIVSTKAGVTASGLSQRTRDFSPAAIRKSVETSMQRLGTRIDWLLLHGPSASELTPDLFKMLEGLQRRGDIGVIGVAGRGAELDAALGTGRFGVFMTPVNVGLNSYELDRLARIRNSGVEVVAIEALAAANRRFPAPVSAGATWRLARALLGRSNPAPPTPMTADECLQWALGEAGAHRVVVTTTRLDHLEANVDSLTAPSSGRLIGG
ncbi:MAG TPA: aldo/keto reductase [Hyphomonadaceae bacterium]|nr:aldo/keto reductase [Hyphomonadaceae bacterium]